MARQSSVLALICNPSSITLHNTRSLDLGGNSVDKSHLSPSTTTMKPIKPQSRRSQPQSMPESARRSPWQPENRRFVPVEVVGGPPTSPFVPIVRKPSPAFSTDSTLETMGTTSPFSVREVNWRPITPSDQTPTRFTPSRFAPVCQGRMTPSGGRSGRTTPTGRSTPSGRVTPTSGRSTPNGRKSPAVDDRKTRLKTELCMHYEQGRPCPFGASCTYAHGEEELQLTKLVDLHEAGLVDQETYRTKPCLTWVMTGSWYVTPRCSCL